MSNLIELATGNVAEIAPSHRGWFVGQFIDSNLPLHSKDLEIKWSEHKEHDRKETPGENNARTLVILIRGKEIIRFPQTNQETILGKEGDFVFFQPNVPHSSEFFPNTLVIIVRWPSLPQA